MPNFAGQFASQFQLLRDSWGPSSQFYFLLACIGLLFTRTFMMVSVTPFLGSRAVPGRVKIVTALAITAFLYPVLRPTFDIAFFPGWNAVLLGLFLKETLVGFAIGLTASLVFYGIQAAGLMIDNQRGVANAQIFVPQLGTQGSIFGLFQFQAAIALFLAIGGHRLFLKAFFEGFLTVPIFYVPPFEMGFYSFFEFFVHLTGNVLLLSAKLSAPVIIAIFLADVVLGIANKVAPQINVFELGFGVKGITGVIVVFVSVSVLYDEFAVVMTDMVTDLKHLFELLAH